MSTSPLISIIVVNYHSAAVIVKLLASLEASSYRQFEVIIVDNDSGADEHSLLEAMASDTVRIIFHDSNAGFGSGCNIGAREAQGEYILLLNPDTMVEPDSLGELVAAAANYPKLGALGCRIVFDDGRPQPSAHYRFPGLFSHFFEYTPILLVLTSRFNRYYGPTLYSVKAHEHPLRAKHLLGAVMLMPRSVYEAVGGFDEDFFLYREETDLCLRLQQHGYSVNYVPHPSITHSAGTSTQNADFSTLDPRYTTSSYLYISKHHNKSYLRLSWLLAMSGLYFSLTCLATIALLKRLRGKKLGQSATLYIKIKACLAWHKTYGRSL